MQTFYFGFSFYYMIGLTCVPKAMNPFWIVPCNTCRETW